MRSTLLCFLPSKFPIIFNNLITERQKSVFFIVPEGETDLLVFLVHPLAEATPVQVGSSCQNPGYTCQHSFGVLWVAKSCFSKPGYRLMPVSEIRYDVCMQKQKKTDTFKGQQGNNRGKTIKIVYKTNQCRWICWSPYQNTPCRE